MDYLLANLVWYVVAALVVGMAVGWFSCGRAED
jgi:hypothetical protein